MNAGHSIIYRHAVKTEINKNKPSPLHHVISIHMESIPEIPLCSLTKKKVGNM